MNTVIMIPARYQSQRFPGKPLAKLKGATGESKTLIARSIDAARSVSGVSACYVLTDDERIAAESERCGCPVLMTSDECRNGTERCADALTRHNIEADLIINLQGDAPLTPPHFVETLIRAMKAQSHFDVATPVLRCDQESLASFRRDRAAKRVGATTAVFGLEGQALYFSKEIIPFSDHLAEADQPDVYHHVGIYAYRPEALKAYASALPDRLEIIEGLEQLRFLALGIRVQCVPVESRGQTFWELNNPTDIGLIEASLATLGKV